MECHVCLEAFDATECRPKVLPCGHTYCLRCLQQLQARKCPVDDKEFEASPEQLPDNFLVLQLSSKPVDSIYARLWCKTCRSVAAELCVDEHAVCGLKEARALEAAKLVEALQRGEAGLDALGEAMDAAAASLDVEACRAQLQREKEGLVAARGRVQGAIGADAAVWTEAKKAAAQDGWSRSAAQLAADLADPSAKCSVTVQRGAAGDVAWRGEARPVEDAAARLLLCRLACRGELQQQGLPAGEQRPAVPRWQEGPNDYDRELTLEEMAASMTVGCRVERGRDWNQAWTEDGTPPGPGTVTEMSDDSVYVKWDRTGIIDGGYPVGCDDWYPLRLLAPPALKPCLATPKQVLDVMATSSVPESKSTKVFTAKELEQVRTLVGLDCDSSPAWSLKLLLQVALNLQGLQMVSPEEQHLYAALAMPQLQALSLTGVAAEQLRLLGQMASLRRLELHCRQDAPLPVLALPAMALRWLRCGVYPLAAALALVRASADSLEELQLVAASEQPYGCPDLPEELRRCGLQKLRRMVLLRETAYGKFCRHDKASCKAQIAGLQIVYVNGGLNVHMLCSLCNRREFEKLSKQ